MRSLSRSVFFLGASFCASTDPSERVCEAAAARGPITQAVELDGVDYELELAPARTLMSCDAALHDRDDDAALARVRVTAAAAIVERFCADVDLADDDCGACSPFCFFLWRSFFVALFPLTPPATRAVPSRSRTGAMHAHAAARVKRETSGADDAARVPPDDDAVATPAARPPPRAPSDAGGAGDWLAAALSLIHI